MTEERELKIPFEEANKISIECKCGAELTVDVRKRTEWANLELKCVVCETDFKTEIKHLLKRLSEAQKSRDEAKTKVFFRIRRTDISN